jgi:hypothetical protein
MINVTGRLTHSQPVKARVVFDMCG